MFANLTCNHKCSNCGSCCTEFLPMTLKEVLAIKKYVEQNNIKMIRHMDDQNIEVKCPFRDDINKCCTIYPVRPKICRSFKCDRPSTELEKEKIRRHSNAFFNHIDEHSTIAENTSTLHSLIYDDYVYEANLIYGLCDYKAEIFNEVIKETYKLKDVVRCKNE